MPDLVMIAAALNSLKAATDIAKFLRESDLSLEKAELKMKLADLVGALAEAKIQLADVQDVLASKDKRIAELEEAFEIKDTLVRRYDAYYVKDSDGNPIGLPYCLRCWDVEHRRRQLVAVAHDAQSRVCTGCGHSYNKLHVGEIQRADQKA